MYVNQLASRCGKALREGTEHCCVIADGAAKAKGQNCDLTARKEVETLLKLTGVSI